MSVPVAELPAAVQLRAASRLASAADGSSLTILDSVDLTIRPGEFVALVGPSGSGKSTLLNILGLLDVPTSGSYRLAGVDVSLASERVRTRLRAEHLSFIFQSFHLAADKTVTENVELGLACQAVPRSRRRPMVERMLNAVGLAERAQAFPSTLSGGEQQRVAVARALVRNSSLILADEPTGNLDSANAETVIALLTGSLRGDSAIVMVTHDPRLAARADRTLQLSAGRLSGARVRG